MAQSVAAEGRLHSRHHERRKEAAQTTGRPYDTGDRPHLLREVGRYPA